MKKFTSLKRVIVTTSLTLGLSLLSSRIFNTSITNLMNDNNLSTTSLNIGQVLYVPSKTYTVQKGDTLYLISKKFNIPLFALRRANNTYTNIINIGQKLNIPTLPAVVTSTTTTPVQPATPPVQTTAPNYSQSDLDLLSRLIMAEAQGESYNAKVAVGAVVMNRVKSGLFPNSVSGVIYQTINGYAQFTPVVNGWINKPADSDSIRAAKEALSGVDPTKGALFYFDDSTTNTWLLAKTVSIKIDNMIYAY
jgi:LysM repeat protein